MIYLSKSEILRINHKLTLQFGGLFLPPHNLMNEGALDYTIEIVKASYFGQELYPTTYLKAAVYKFNIISDHIFQDGNKRTGFETLLLFFEKNNIYLDENVKDEELISFTLAVAESKVTIEQIAEWYQARTRVISSIQ